MSGLNETPETEKYRGCNHYHEIDNEFQQEVTINEQTFVADKQLIPLLEELNENGLITRSHNYDAKTGRSWVVIELKNITHIEQRLDWNTPEVLIEWVQEPMKKGIV